jgi:hypothetical protein
MVAVATDRTGSFKVAPHFRANDQHTPQCRVDGIPVEVTPGARKVITSALSGVSTHETDCRT